MIEAAGPATGRDGLGRRAGRACTGDGSLRVGVDRHSPERTPHIRRVELGAAPTGEHQIVVHPLLANPNPLGELAAMLAKRVDAERQQL
jgi:hypothetical protein